MNERMGGEMNGKLREGEKNVLEKSKNEMEKGMKERWKKGVIKGGKRRE